MSKRRHRGRALRRRYGRAGSAGVVDEHAKNELDLYAENTFELYGQKTSILKNIDRRLAKGTFDVTKAAKLWLYWVDAAARMYKKEHGSIFNKATRMALAEEYAKQYAKGSENGNIG